MACTAPPWQPPPLNTPARRLPSPVQLCRHHGYAAHRGGGPGELAGAAAALRTGAAGLLCVRLLCAWQQLQPLARLCMPCPLVMCFNGVQCAQRPRRLISLQSWMPAHSLDVGSNAAAPA